MFIQDIDFSEDAEEALLYITDGVYYCVAFCQPCHQCVGNFLEELLFAFNSNSPVLNSTYKKLYIKRKNDSFRHEILAQVIDVKENLVRVGKILIRLDVDLPGDIKNKDFIEFTCGRLDIF